MTLKYSNVITGKVIIAGAGPGDPELITLKAFRYLQNADVVVVDRLVSDQLLVHCKPEAKIIFAGKQGGNDKSISQAEINAIIVENAMQHELVLRLKGGDVSIFSNLLDELETLVSHNIPYEIIPGITAASGAAAFAGIPLTARDHSTAVRFLTCYNPDSFKEEEWCDLAKTNDTLVFYMSANKLDIILGKLLDHKISPSRQLAIIEQATTPQQSVQVFNVYEYEMRPSTKRSGLPTLIIIGKVAGLYEQFKWLPDSQGNEYFRPLENVNTTVISNFIS
jgi:uroporphyrin-III C-methyltransferase